MLIWVAPLAGGPEQIATFAPYSPSLRAALLGYELMTRVRAWNDHAFTYEMMGVTKDLIYTHLHSSKSDNCTINLSSCSSRFFLSFSVSDFPLEAIEILLERYSHV
jgi:hypothetical protein